jgi:hypothetical protein
MRTDIVQEEGHVETWKLSEIRIAKQSTKRAVDENTSGAGEKKKKKILVLLW